MQEGAGTCTLEPGGQLEMSGAPLEDINAVERELDNDLNEVLIKLTHDQCGDILFDCLAECIASNELFAQVNTIGKELGLGFAGIGYEPKCPLSERPCYEKVAFISPPCSSKRFLSLQLRIVMND